MRRYEPAIARRADHVIVVSERDRERLPCDHVTVIENGVDTDVFFPVPERRRANALVFSGNMGYEPNVDAAVWLVERCLPLVRARIPDVSLDIVGARPARAVRRLASRGATVTGPVDSMPAALNEASVAVVPLRSGSGIQNKILEAMACGLPVVTTSVGLGTIDATPGVELLVADGEAEFAEAIVRLLRDPTLRAELGRRARERVVAGYSWDRGAELVEQIYRDVVDKR
jgi:glycosyltransferase involved in cell wall biosynthesis